MGERMIPEVFVLYNKYNKEVYVRSACAWRQVNHDPWFLAETIPRFRDSKHEELFDELVKSIDYTDTELLIFNEKTWRYDIRKKAVKIVTHNPLDVRKLVKLFEKYNVHHALSNIRYIARCSLDLIHELYCYKIPLILHYKQSELESALLDIYEKSKDVKVAVLDIEVESKGSFPKLSDKVLLIGIAVASLHDAEPEEVLILEGDDVFKAIDLVLKYSPDYIVGFNAVGFDLPYLQAYTNDARIVTGTNQAGIKDGDTIIPLLDLYPFAKNYGQPLGLKSHTSRSLDQVAKDLGLISREEEELEKSIDRNNIAREYRENREKLLKYLETDVRLTLRIARKWLPVLILLYSITGISPYAQQWLPSLGSLAEYALTEYLLKKHGIALEVRSRVWSFGEYEERFIPWISRGHKNIAIEGTFENVAQLDFDMLYPTIAYEYKVDPTSLVISDDGFPVLLYKEVEVKDSKSKRKEKLTETRILKVKFSDGPIHEFYSYVYTLRRITKKIKRERGISDPDSAVKVLANSAYGIFSKPRGAGLNEALSAFIFIKANQILNATMRYVEQVLGRKVVYGDTDSLFIVLSDGDSTEKITDKVNNFIKLFGEGFSIKLEDTHRRMAVYSSKNYVCINSKDDVIIKGIHRFYAPHTIKDNLESIVRLVLDGKDPEDVVKDYLMKTSRIEDLFVYSVKSLDELYDFEEHRFKQSTHPVTRAILLSYLHSVACYLPSNSNSVLNGVAKDIVVLVDDIHSNIVLSAHWLSRSSDTVCILVEPDKDRAKLLCGKFMGKPRTNEKQLVQPAVLWLEEVGRDKIVDMALRTSQTLLVTLKKIHGFVAGRRS